MTRTPVVPSPRVFVSWPGLARPSTTLSKHTPQVVDGRTKSGHDTFKRSAAARSETPSA
jgi:hypothetical protein